MKTPMSALTSYAFSPREQDVLLRLASFRYLTRPQIEEFLFDGSLVGAGSRRVIVSRVVGRLRARGLLQTTGRLAGGPEGGSARLLYSLTGAGMTAARGVAPGMPERRPALRGTFFMSHALMTAEVALAFRRAARTYSGHEVVDWECDWQALERLGVLRVVPDAHLVYRTARVELDAFLEVDRGTEGTRRFARKIARYLDLYRSAAWRGHLPTWPVVLTVAPTETRATALLRVTESLLSSQARSEHITKVTEFAFSSLPPLLGPTGPLGDIWQVAGRTGRHPLLRPDEIGQALV
jgi:hypothetical protein